MTNEQLAEIKTRVEAATPGPWIWDETPRGEWGSQGPDLESGAMSEGEWHKCPDGKCLWGSTRWPQRPSAEGHEHFLPKRILSSWGYDADGLDVEKVDAEFIAHARVDVPALLAEVERLRAIVPPTACGPRLEGGEEVMPND